MIFEELLNILLTSNNNVNLQLIKRAYEFAKQAHIRQYRLSGEEFIHHPVNVAKILAELNMDTETITAALLHDVVEDTPVRALQIKATFGEEIFQLVDAATKIDKVNFRTKEEEKVENLRKMFLSMAHDVRVVFLKLADRLDNMRTLSLLEEEKRKELAKETLEIFAPLAHRLGIYQIKWELEDLAFKCLNSEIYHELAEKIDKKRIEREYYIEKIKKRLSDEFQKENITATITGRPKHIYGIYQKMKRYNTDFSYISDLIGIRVIVNTIPECYKVLGIIHNLWKPIPGTFDDYIAVPKSNMYQSLHTTVLTEDGEKVEIQIRNEEMHRKAEYGVAAHWKYKEGGLKYDEFDEKITFLRQLLEWHKDIKETQEFMESIKFSLFTDEVFVFTPKGDVIELPEGATPVDFAYKIHTDIGHRCAGCKVNGRLVPLDYELQNGEIVEIITKHIKQPSIDWLNFVKTSHARSKIKHWLRSREFIEAVDHGKSLIKYELRRNNLPEDLINSECIKEITNILNLKNTEQLFAQVGFGDISSSHIVNQLKERLKIKEVPIYKVISPQVKLTSGEGIIVDGYDNILVRLAKCCYPLPHDEIIGFITKSKGISIHKIDCKNLENKIRLVHAKWDDKREIYCEVNLKIESKDRIGLVNDITHVIKEYDTNITKLKVDTIDGKTVIVLKIGINSNKKLSKIIDGIKNVRSVEVVERIL